ncbi:hypothetical protein ACNHKD_18565 [Methylocystis sp. JAN1]|uniref:hypothetical protein n=1 Tax=Methylocystis sp. JAN1 TaxID=3397211 RepID=UPI003FA25449
MLFSAAVDRIKAAEVWIERIEMKGYLYAGVALCLVAFAMNAGWIPRPASNLETAATPAAPEKPVVSDPTAALEPASATAPPAAPERQPMPVGIDAPAPAAATTEADASAKRVFAPAAKPDAPPAPHARRRGAPH